MCDIRALVGITFTRQSFRIAETTRLNLGSRKIHGSRSRAAGGNHAGFHGFAGTSRLVRGSFKFSFGERLIHLGEIGSRCLNLNWFGLGSYQSLGNDQLCNALHRLLDRLLLWGRRHGLRLNANHRGLRRKLNLGLRRRDGCDLVGDLGHQLLWKQHGKDEDYRSHRNLKNRAGCEGSARHVALG